MEIGFFDTWPDDDLAHYNGLWGVYPYFPSGTVIGSDIEKGLFVWSLPGPAVPALPRWGVLLTALGIVAAAYRGNPQGRRRGRLP